jgi:methylglutaconyl-CoA hydratase
MAERGNVSSSVADGIATVSFSHPKSNSLPAEILAQLAECVRAAGANEAARVIVLRSEGAGAFCAGASFDELRAISNESEGTQFFMGFGSLILAMIRAPKFVISRVHGKTVGGGVGIVAASDYAIASRAASVRLSELAVGIGPFVVGPVIERKIGLGGFSALAVDADWRDADWGERRGLFSRLVEDTAALDDAVSSLARTLAQSNPEAMTRLKAAFWAGTERWEELLKTRAAASGKLVLSEFARRATQSR